MLCCHGNQRCKVSQNDCRFKEGKLARLNTSAKRHNQTLHNQIIVKDQIRFVDVSELLVLDVFFWVVFFFSLLFEENMLNLCSHGGSVSASGLIFVSSFWECSLHSLSCTHHSRRHRDTAQCHLFCNASNLHSHLARNHSQSDSEHHRPHR